MESQELATHSAFSFGRRLFTQLYKASDDWVLTPWLQGRELDMSFVTIILAVLIGGAVAGLLGMLLAVPSAACVRIYWTEVVKPKLARYAEWH